jgi:hypothetical protein
MRKSNNSGSPDPWEKLTPQQAARISLRVSKIREAHKEYAWRFETYVAVLYKAFLAKVLSNLT